MTWWLRRGLRFKIVLVVSLTLTLVLGALLTVAVVTLRSYMQEREEQAAGQLNQMFVANVRQDMMINDWQRVRERAKSAGQSEDSQIEVIAIYAWRQDAVGVAYERMVLSVFETGFPGGRLIDRSSLEKKQFSEDCAVCHSLPPGQRPTVLSHSLEGQTVLRTAVPLYNEASCQTCHGTARAALGMSLMDFRLERFQRNALFFTMLLGGSGVAAIILALVILFLLVNRMVIRPLRDTVHTTRAIAQGDWDQSVPVSSEDEVGQLGQAFNEMTGRLATAYRDVQQALAEREEKTTELQRALDEIQQGHAAQDRLLQMIHEMSTPVIPVQQGVLVMPLVGVIDTARAQSILAALLEAIEKERARVIILDVTGVPMVDTAVAQTLLQAARAARLLGADPVLVGISPAVAETIVSLGVDLTDLVTRADLQSGVEYALQR